MKKALLIASVSSMIDQFNMPNIYLLQSMGYSVDVACNFVYGNTSSGERVGVFKSELDKLDVKHYQVGFARNVFNVLQIIKAYKQLNQIFKQNSYSLVHCHSPVGGLLGRILSHRYKVTVIYTAHGFHFFKGAPLINWLLYYPIERWMARYTDVLITINSEDYARAKRFKAGKVEYIPGVGIDVERFTDATADRDKTRNELGIPVDAIMLLSVGELNSNKNHEVIIRALAKLSTPDIHYCIAGRGSLRNHLKKLCEKLNVSANVYFLGFRSDIADLMHSADVYIQPSKREGLSVALMEAMACGLPIICSKIRGNVDLVLDNISGYLCDPNDADRFAARIKKLSNDNELRARIGTSGQQKIMDFDITSVMSKSTGIYTDAIERLMLIAR